MPSQCRKNLPWVLTVSLLLNILQPLPLSCFRQVDVHTCIIWKRWHRNSKVHRRAKFLEFYFQMLKSDIWQEVCKPVKENHWAFLLTNEIRELGQKRTAETYFISGLVMGHISLTGFWSRATWSHGAIVAVRAWLDNGAAEWTRLEWLRQLSLRTTKIL